MKKRMIGVFYSSLLILLPLISTAQKLSLDRWKYIQVDDHRGMYGDQGPIDWVRFLGLAMGDLNHDGYKEIVSGKYVYINPGGNMESPWKRVEFDFNVDGMIITDVDGDEYPDVIGEALPDIYWLEATDLTATSWTARIVGRIPATTHTNGQGYKAVDLLGDKRNEILLSGGGGVYLCKIPPSPDRDTWDFRLIAPTGSEEGIGVGDIDQDGDQDIAIGIVPEGEKEPTEARWFINPGNADTTWKSLLVGHIPHPIDRVAVADLNGDHKPDIAISEERWPGLEPDANLWWFENQGSHWERHHVYTGYSLNNLDAGDMDRDGDIDLITNEHKGTLHPTLIFENNGAGIFTKHVLDTGKEGHLGTRIADMDGDGDPDVVSAAWDKYKYLHLWRNDAIRDQVTWKHISSENGALPVPNSGNEQTACLAVDIDKDGRVEFFISERTAAPSLVMYKKNGNTWDRYIIEKDPLRIEAGSAHADIDGDGDQDIVFGGESQSNEVWWWQNPYPKYDPKVPWKRYYIKRSGQNKHHDQLFGDFDGDGKQELVFWNQNAGKLFITEIPKKPTKVTEWPRKVVYQYNTDSEMRQRGYRGYPSWKTTNEHEGLTKGDIDGDGVMDIVGGGRWFRYDGKGHYLENIVDASYPFSRAAVGDFIEGGRPEIIFVVGDGVAPMMMYEWKKGTWIPHTVIPEVYNGHTLGVVDFNGDGHLDIFSGEMRFGDDNPGAKIRVMLGDGKGHFRERVVARGYAIHEGRMVDLDGDGDLDIIDKPYTWKAPRIDLWLQQ